MPSMWTSRRALKVHLTAAVVVPGCLALAWWQVTRALGGNTLSWAYTVEWPVFGAYALYMWWKLLHEQPTEVPAQAETGSGDARAEIGADDARAASAPGTPPAPSTPSAPGTPSAAGPGPGAGDDEQSEEEAAYNQYLAALHASGRRKHW